MGSAIMVLVLKEKKEGDPIKRYTREDDKNKSCAFSITLGARFIKASQPELGEEKKSSRNKKRYSHSWVASRWVTTLRIK
ncbi:hypothetical protein SORBI_3008G068166 [Sorghum bicolor]|uniref:Uncharacterized protein n=1 Tax=Sorghum bicolor TaxID=4558 RepID=A0A1Z5R606_SORBI|nr:hypothetical protein SORBI_3008G068166 [Sorghum bicolor]